MVRPPPFGWCCYPSSPLVGGAAFWCYPSCGCVLFSTPPLLLGGAAFLFLLCVVLLSSTPLCRLFPSWRCCFGWRCCISILLWCGAAFSCWVVLFSRPFLSRPFLSDVVGLLLVVVLSSSPLWMVLLSTLVPLWAVLRWVVFLSRLCAAFSSLLLGVLLVLGAVGGAAFSSSFWVWLPSSASLQ